MGFSNKKNCSIQHLKNNSLFPYLTKVGPDLPVLSTICRQLFNKNSNEWLLVGMDYQKSPKNHGSTHLGSKKLKKKILNKSELLIKTWVNSFIFIIFEFFATSTGNRWIWEQHIISDKNKLQHLEIDEKSIIFFKTLVLLFFYHLQNFLLYVHNFYFHY